jgi:hypothetical protein
MFGSADATHFNLPNDLGIFERNWANGDSMDPDRATRTAPTATGATISAGDHVGTEEADELKSHRHNLWRSASATLSTSAAQAYDAFTAQVDSGKYTRETGGNETRPINRAYLPIIKDG